MNANEKAKCECLISEDECKKVLKEMKNQKSPGSDGLTTDLYKNFWLDIKTYFVNALNLSYQTGHLSELQKQLCYLNLAKIRVFCKTGDLCLLNVDYKIATKVIANRIKPLLPSIINKSQTGFMKGRYIGENIRLICEILETTEAQNLPGLVSFLILKKHLTV